MNRDFRFVAYRMSKDIRGVVSIRGGVEATRWVDARDGDVLVPKLSQSSEKWLGLLVDLPPSLHTHFTSPLHHCAEICSKHERILLLSAFSKATAGVF
jgi:hypothetical protein